MQDSKKDQIKPGRRVWGCWRARLAHRGQRSEEMWENRRRGQDVVTEREGENEPGGSEIKFEGQTFDWVYSLSMCLLVQAVSEWASERVRVCVRVCILNVRKQMGHHLSSADKSVRRKKKGKLPSVKRFLLSAVNLWTCESRAYAGIL